MIRLTVNKLANILSGKTIGVNVSFNSVTIDTRKINTGCLFIALKGNYFDAHDFAIQAKESGVVAMLVDRKINIDLPQIIVKDTNLALGQLASWIRQQVSTRIVALTGSSGKTQVKEMTASILNNCGKTIYTIDNLNNFIGVSMTLLRLNNKYNYAVIELGANHKNEIFLAVSMTKPEAALVNNITEAHLEGFGSLENVAKSKGEIYAGLPVNGIAILNADSNDWKNWKSIIGSRKTWYFSLNSKKSDFTVTNIQMNHRNSRFTIQTPIGSINVHLHLPGWHNISNAIAAASLSMAVGAPLKAIKIGLKDVKAMPGRLFPIFLSDDNQLLLDDSYNANVSSMIAAIQVLSDMPGYRVMVVGDMAELGDKTKCCHEKVGEAAKKSRLDLLLSIGNFSKIISEKSGIGEHFLKKNKIIKRLIWLIKEHKKITILVKGSRSAAMEEIVQALQESKNASLDC